jgi:hypothetical protein
MAQPLRCDVHPENAGVLLIQDLIGAKVLVGCPECVIDMSIALAQSTGGAELIVELAQQELYEAVAAQKAEKAKPRARKPAAAAAGPQDTDQVGESPVDAE